MVEYGLVQARHGLVRAIKARWVRYFEGVEIVDFSWFSKVLSSLKVVHMIREIG